MNRNTKVKEGMRRKQGSPREDGKERQMREMLKSHPKDWLMPTVDLSEQRRWRCLEFLVCMIDISEILFRSNFVGLKELEVPLGHLFVK